MIHLVLGGARSGKSSFAENIVNKLSDSLSEQKTYIATAMPVDVEIIERIALHQEQRKHDSWQTIEVPTHLAGAVSSFKTGQCYLIDCLTMWLNNLIFEFTEQGKSFEQINSLLTLERQQLVDALQASNSAITIVSNEVGLGVIPMGQSTRLFVDHLGWLNQQLGAISTDVTLITAGIAQSLKTNNPASDEQKEG